METKTMKLNKGVYLLETEVNKYESINHTSIFFTIRVKSPIAKNKLSYVGSSRKKLHTVDPTTVKLAIINFIAKNFGGVTKKDYKEIDKICL